MEYAAECFSTLAQLLDFPDQAFGAYIALATDPALMPAAAAGHVALFAERVSDLSLEERQELFAETFGSEAADAERRHLVTTLREWTRSGSAARAGLLKPLLCTLHDRNPYWHVVTAIETLLAVSDGAAV